LLRSGDVLVQNGRACIGPGCLQQLRLILSNQWFDLRLNGLGCSKHDVFDFNPVFIHPVRNHARGQILQADIETNSKKQYLHFLCEYRKTDFQLVLAASPASAGGQPWSFARQVYLYQFSIVLPGRVRDDLAFPRCGKN
jgi:hypothetical protein